MIQRADYIVPYFNNQLRLDKPPLAYWAQVASYRIFGESDFGARFPSTIAAALTALVILAWGYRVGAAAVGWWAAIIFTLSLQTFVHAKAAVADMWLVLFMTLAHWAGMNSSHRPRTSNAPTATVRANGRGGGVFYLSLAFGFLAKGPIAWIPLLTVGATIFLTRDWQLARHFKFLSWNFADARGCCSVGNPSANSNSRRILCDRNRAACHWSLAGHDGRSRGEFVWDVSAAFAVLLRDGFRQFLSLVD